MNSDALTLECPACPEGMSCICEELKPSPLFDEKNMKLGKEHHITGCKEVNPTSSFPKTLVELHEKNNFVVWEKITNAKTTRYIVGIGDGHWSTGVVVFDDNSDGLLDRICTIAIRKPANL